MLCVVTCPWFAKAMAQKLRESTLGDEIAKRAKSWPTSTLGLVSGCSGTGSSLQLQMCCL
jgi:hypothetical protein